MPTYRSVAKADVAELTAALDSAVTPEKEHHLIVVSTNKVLSTTQFKQMFYSRGDDFFQIANVYECPDSCDSVHSSVWGIDCKDPHNSAANNFAGLYHMGHNRLAGSGGVGNANNYKCYNFNKLGGRENDPEGCAWAYSYVHDQSRNFYAQHEVMGYLEKDTCVKRDFWTACSRMSIEDQLYGLAFASETDQDLCMAVTCARRWSEVEDALAESCTAANKTIKMPSKTEWLFTKRIPAFNGNAVSFATGDIFSVQWGALVYLKITMGANVANVALLAQHINEFAIDGTTNSHTFDLGTGWLLSCPPIFTDAPQVVSQPIAPAWETKGYPAEAAARGNTPTTEWLLSIYLTRDNCDPDALKRPPVTNNANNFPQFTIVRAGGEAFDYDAPYNDGLTLVDTVKENPNNNPEYAPTYVDLHINVRVTNGHPEALDTILRVRFTVGYAFHEPSALNTWNTRASTAAAGVIQSGVVGDAPEGGKEQHEDTTVVN